MGDNLYNGNDGCNKNPIPQISHWHNELCGNEIDPSMKNGEKNLMVHKKLGLKRCPKTYMRVMLKEAN